jgi:hypothetical protein
MNIRVNFGVPELCLEELDHGYHTLYEYAQFCSSSAGA